jgi:hypothetical protein
MTLKNMTVIGGPTVLIEAGGFRIVTAFPDAVIVAVHSTVGRISPKAATTSSARSLRSTCDRDCKCSCPALRRRSSLRHDTASLFQPCVALLL